MGHEHLIVAMCQGLEVSRSGYFQWRRARPLTRASRTDAIKAKISLVHEPFWGTY
jgi:hypothetical protein